MPVLETGRHNLPLLAVTQAQKEITHNEALVLIDALLHTAVEGVALTAPALTDSDIGKCWLVGSGATGVWANKSGQIAIWIGGDWRYLVAHDGMRLWDRSNGRDSIYTDGVWRSGPIITNPSGGAVIDSEARATLGTMLQYFRLIGILAP